MFDTLIKEKVTDFKRISVVGGSNGSVMTQFLAFAMPERIAGIGVMVATLPKAGEKDWPKPKVPVPTAILMVMSSRGQADDAVSTRLQHKIP